MRKGILIALSVLVIALVLSSIFFINKNRHPPITITSYASMVKMSLDDLASGADLIVIGEFTAIHPGRWNTPNGKLPENATLKTVSRQHLIIFTDANFAIKQFLKGDANNPIARIRTFGGQVEQDRMIVSSEPSFTTGKTYLLFLSQDTGSTSAIDPGDYLVLGGIQGTYEITGNKAVSDGDEWILEDLIVYIHSVLSTNPTP